MYTKPPKHSSCNKNTLITVPKKPETTSAIDTSYLSAIAPKATNMIMPSSANPKMPPGFLGTVISVFLVQLGYLSTNLVYMPIALVALGSVIFLLRNAISPY